MALSVRMQSLIRNLARQGDSFAKAAAGTTTAKDDLVLGSLSKRGDS
jgi:hypothetical protein